MRNTIDGKFTIGEKYATEFEIINIVSGESIPEDEPLFLLRGRDGLALGRLEQYRAACVEAGCNELHIAGVNQVLSKFRKFREEHPERMKQPGITKHLRLEESREP
jgi:hypothetical protein